MAKITQNKVSSCVRSTGEDYLASMMRIFNETKMAALALVLMQMTKMAAGVVIRIQDGGAYERIQDGDP